MSELSAAMSAAATGLRAQTTRMRIASENIANANSTGATPGSDPYRRRVPVMQEREIRETGALGVRVINAVEDPSDFRLRFDPNHPAADERGMVKLPNVDSLVEMLDLREAARAYEANLSIVENSRAMVSRALDLLRR